MTTPPILRAPMPRVDVTFLGRQIGLAIALKHQPYATFTWEILIVLGPMAIAIGLIRRMRA